MFGRRKKEKELKLVIEESCEDVLGILARDIEDLEESMIRCIEDRLIPVHNRLDNIMSKLDSLPTVRQKKPDSPVSKTKPSKTKPSKTKPSKTKPSKTKSCEQSRLVVSSESIGEGLGSYQVREMHYPCEDLDMSHIVDTCIKLAKGKRFVFICGDASRLSDVKILLKRAGRSPSLLSSDNKKKVIQSWKKGTVDVLLFEKAGVFTSDIDGVCIVFTYSKSLVEGAKKSIISMVSRHEDDAVVYVFPKKHPVLSSAWEFPTKSS
jgi:hypothetical protein